MARYAYNPFTRKLDRESGVDVLTLLPATGAEGDMVLNRSDNKVYIYFAGSWQALSAGGFTGPTYATYGSSQYDTPSSGTYA